MGNREWSTSRGDRRQALPWRSVVGLAALALIGLVGCTGNRSSQLSGSPPIAATPLPESSASSPSSSPSLSPSPLASPPSVKASPPPSRLKTITLYRIDNLCDQLVPEAVTVPADKPMESAVGQIVDRQSSADFELAGYRVLRQPGSTQVTIDFRRAPGAKRGFTSLSTCEQLALFGSLQKTLTSNADWGIKTVIFTEGGKEITL